MNKYEIMYIVRPSLEESALKSLIKEMNEIIPNNGGKVEKVNEWGMKELAYEIEKHRKGFYVILNAIADPEALNEFDRLARIKENVIRHIIVKNEE